MSVQKKNISTIIRELIDPEVSKLGYSVWDVEYVKMGADRHLVVTIDSKKGVDINACETVHRAIDPILDEVDLIEDSYYLDVSSPGIERNIRTKEHYFACKGETVSLKLFTAFEGKKNIIGILVELDESEDTVVILDDNGNEYRVPLKQISKTNIHFEIKSNKNNKKVGGKRQDK